MYEPNTTSLAHAMTLDFSLPVMMDSGFTAEDLAEDAFGMQINFPRIKIPGGGGLAFEIPQGDATQPLIAQTIQGVIVYHHPMNTYWAQGKDDKNAPPNCASHDGLMGSGNPGVVCKDCAHNQWGTGKEGIGKACKNGFSLYLLRSGEFLPVHIQLPPTSIKSFSDFITSFQARQRPAFASLVEIGLRKCTNGGGDDYSVATFKLIRDFADSELGSIMNYARGMRAQIKAMNEQRTSSNLERQFGDATYPANGNGEVMDYPGPHYSDLEYPEDEELLY